MQKKVLAAVIGGLVAAPAVFADSANVTISGRVAVGLESYKLSGEVASSGPVATTSLKDELRVSDQSSAIIFSGSEDLGGGLKAWFQIDARFAPDLGSLSATGNTLAGLAGGFGKIGLGRSDLHYNEANGLGGIGRSASLQTYLSAGLGSQVEGVSIANGTRTPNVIMWDSPDFGGITARLALSTNAAANEGSGVNNGSKDNSYNAALRYAGGPIIAGVSIWKQNAEGPLNSASLATAGTPAAPVDCVTSATATNLSKGVCLGSAGDQNSTKAWVGYKMPALQIGLAYDTSEITAELNGTKVKRNAFVLPVTVPLGANSLYFSFAKADKTSVGGTKIADTGATAYSLGWETALSKRTSVGAFYTKLDNKLNSSYDLFAIAASGATPVSIQGGQDVTQIYLGIGHFF